MPVRTPNRSSRRSNRSSRSNRNSRQELPEDTYNPSSPSVIEPSTNAGHNESFHEATDDNVPLSQRSVSAISDQLYLSDGPVQRYGSSVRAGTGDGRSNSVFATIQEQGVDGDTRSYIWGTRICLSEVDTAFKRFLKEFHVPDGSPGYYMDVIKDAVLSELDAVDLNLQHIKSFDEPLYHQIVNYPNDLITFMDFSLNDFIKVEFPDFPGTRAIQIKPYNVDRTYGMKMLEPDDIHKLVSVDGMVTRATGIIPEMREGLFECVLCAHTEQTMVNLGQIIEPTVCSNCNGRASFCLISNKSIFTDRQIIKLQEFPDQVPPGQAPLTVTVYLLDNLVDVVMPGDRVNITGIYRCEPVRDRPVQRTLRSVMRTFIDAVHVSKLDKNKILAEGDISWIKPDRIEQIRQMAQRPDVYEQIAHAVAPGIYGHEDVKQALLFLLFGGTRKDFSSVAVGSSRAEVNILLCGDPGTAKSQMLQCVHRLLPRGQYVSGKGTSAAGLTAVVTRDLETKHFVLQIGALALSDNGVCCIDEFDKMNDNIRSVLQEVMEQQTLSVAKAGIVCQLNARASILAAANPIGSQWNAQKTILENVQLPHTLLSRFDLIFLMVDPQDETYDRKLAGHLVSMYFVCQEEMETESMDTSLLKDYIVYAKAMCHPIMSRAAANNLIEKYVNMRQGNRNTGQISAYPRQLESLIRLAEARAKIRLADVVEEQDVEHAYALYREALKQAATDPATGRVDVNILALGVSAASRRASSEIRELIKANLMSKSDGAWISLKALLTEIRDKSTHTIRRDAFEEVVNDMCKDDLLFRGRRKPSWPEVYSRTLSTVLDVSHCIQRIYK